MSSSSDFTFSPSEQKLLENYFSLDSLFFTRKGKPLALHPQTEEEKGSVYVHLETFSRLIGNMMLRSVPREKHIYVCTLDNYTYNHKKEKILGVGRFLLEVAFFKAIKHHYKGLLQLGVTRESQPFYKKLGFIILGNHTALLPYRIRRIWKERLPYKALLAQELPLPCHLLDYIVQYIL